MAKRDDFTDDTKRALRERVGGRCSRPECGRLTVSPNADDASRVDVPGRAAHITAAQAGGPRFNVALTTGERRSAHNGIWLCSDCADLIDKNEGEGFRVEQLRSWKRVAEDNQSVAARLRVRVRRPAWLDHLKTPHYVNVPRLLHIVGTDALSGHTLTLLERGFPKGRAIIRELVEVESALRQMTIEAIDVRDINDPAHQLSEGLLISYHHQCRTKNGTSESTDDVRNYSFERSPLIYLDCNGYRYIQPYDPDWITTNTAQGTVRMGSCKLAGIGIIKVIDHDKRHTIASPLTFGIPDLFGFT
jgi:hypothetical protein